MIFSRSSIVYLLPLQVFLAITFKHWPLKRDVQVHVNYHSEQRSLTISLTALLLDAHQSPARQQNGAVVTQYCNSSRKEHPFENKVIHSTKTVPVLLPFPLIAVSPCLDWLVSNPLMAVE